MRVVELIESGVSVVLDLRAPDKRGVLDALARRLAELADLSEDAVREALTAREALGSTGVGRGVAVPHAWIGGASRRRAVFARLARPIDFDAVDGEPVDLVCAIVGPAATASKPGSAAGPLAALACVSRALREPTRAERLRRAASVAAFRAVLADDAPHAGCDPAGRDAG